MVMGVVAASGIQTKSAPLRVALAGNPNCGKTTLFNALTGLNYKVANYPGVTVERKEGRATLGTNKAVIIDLPGIYSLTGHSIDEVIASRALLGQLPGTALPDVVVCVIDAANLERNLYLATQIIDLGFPVILALNMCDIADKRGIKIRKEILARQLDVPVISLVANKQNGIQHLISAITSLAAKGPSSSKRYSWSNGTPLLAASDTLGGLSNESTADQKRFFGLSLLSDAIAPTNDEQRELAKSLKRELLEKGVDSLTAEATLRYKWINQVVKSCSVREEGEQRLFSERLDSIITHRIWGTIIFFSIMAFIFQSIFLWASLPMDLIDQGVSWCGEYISQLLPAGLLRSLIVDGVVAGVGGVLVFIPQIAILFFLLSLLEDSGYLSRAAFLMDKVMRRFGLQGRSFIPLLSSFACAIPGILSTRTIASFSDRMTTILVAPLMSCSARLPVYAVLIAAFVPEVWFGIISLQGLVLLSMYLLGILGAIVVSLILKRTVFKGEPALFVMEMPPFRAPSLKLALTNAWDRVMLFMKSAGTVILACSVLLWFLASFPQGEVKESYAGQIGQAMEPVIKPLGYNWEIGVGILASLAAREVFVSSLATIYNLEAADDEAASRSLVTTLQEKRESGEFPLKSALSLMVFYVFACMCMSTVAAARRETGSWGWSAFMFLYMTALAYGGAWITYTIAGYLT